MKSLKSEFAALMACYIILITAAFTSGCQKDDTPKIDNPGYRVVEHCDDNCDGSRAGFAPTFNLAGLYVDSTITGGVMQELYNGVFIDSILANLSGLQGVNLNGIIYHHYKPPVKIRYTDGKVRTYNVPIYINNATYSNLRIKGPLTSWSSLSENHKSKSVRYERLGSYKPDYLPYRGEVWRKYDYIITDGINQPIRTGVLPRNKLSRHFKAN